MKKYLIRIETNRSAGNEFNLAMIKSEWCGVPVTADFLMKNR